MRIDIVTIFPDYFGPGRRTDGPAASGPLGVSLIGKAAARGDIDFRVHDLRLWATDVHHTVDDTPFGGGPGMVMKPDVWGAALDAVLAAAEPVPAGQPGGTVRPARLVVPDAVAGCRSPRTWPRPTRRSAHLVFACGRYEGIDGGWSPTPGRG